MMHFSWTLSTENTNTTQVEEVKAEKYRVSTSYLLSKFLTSGTNSTAWWWRYAAYESCCTKGEPNLLRSNEKTTACYCVKPNSRREREKGRWVKTSFVGGGTEQTDWQNYRVGIQLLWNLLKLQGFMTPSNIFLFSCDLSSFDIL